MKIVFFAAALAMAAPAYAEFRPSDRYLEAGVELATASTCMNELDDSELFEFAFERFRSVALAEANGPSVAEIENVRLKMISHHTENTPVNMFSPLSARTFAPSIFWTRHPRRDAQGG